MAEESFDTLQLADGRLSRLVSLIPDSQEGRIDTPKLTVDTTKGVLAITAEDGSLTIRRQD